MTGLYKGQAVV